MNQSHYDVIVVGGGAVGCLSAWQLSQSGHNVLLVEKGQLGRESSVAAAGMLGAQMEMHEDGPMFQMCLESRSLYPHLAASLLQETGVNIGLKEDGILRLAHDKERVEELHHRGEWQRAAGAKCLWWTPADVEKYEPTIADNLGGMYFPDDSSISAPLLSRALAAMCQKTCDVMEGTPVEQIVTNGDRRQVVTVHGTFTADYIVVAAGAWAKTLLADVGIDFPVYPVKGQILSVRPRKPVLSRVVFADGVYLVPKSDGTIVIGATEEHEAGFDTAVTARGVSGLLHNALQIVPALADAELVETWVGLRPGTPTGQPLIGAIPGNSQVIVAAGHFRNGVLLAPSTAQLIVNTVNGQPRPAFADAFVPPAAASMEVTS